jgi:hypothetical protein
VAQHLTGLITRMRDQATEHRRDRVRLEAEGGHDPEIAAAAAEGPEEVGMLFGARRQQGAVGGNDFERNDVVATQAVLADQPADSAPQRQPGDTSLGHDPHRHR